MIAKLENVFKKADFIISDKNLKIDTTNFKDFHFATNIALVIAKEKKTSPMEMASTLVNFVKKNTTIIEKIEVAKPGFVNIKLKDEFLAIELDKILKIKKPKPKNYVVDYSSPNIAKKMHVGHLRSTVIGDSIYKILKHFGNNVVGISHIGDWGTQFGKLIYAYQNWVDKDKYKKDPIIELERLYVKFHKHEEKEPEILDKAKAILVKLQAKQKPYIDLWKDFCKKSLEEYNKSYKKLNIKIDKTIGESFYQDFMPSVVKKLMDKKIAKEDKGAKVVYFNEDTKLPPIIIQKADGAFLYSTSDLATIDYRVKKSKVNNIVYVVDSRQANHFNQVFEIAKKFYPDINLYHAEFGIMSLPKEVMSSRKGNVIYLQDILEQGYEKAYKIVNEKNPHFSILEKKEIASKISTGAIKFFDLVHQRNSNIVFNIEKALSFSGKSAPYIQYSYVRINSLLKKAKSKPVFKNIKASNQKEIELIKKLYEYKGSLQFSYSKYEPHYLANYLYNLTSLFNSWYQDVKILKDKDNLNSRLYLAKSVQEVLSQGLNLLGIDVMEKM